MKKILFALLLITSFSFGQSTTWSTNGNFISTATFAIDSTYKAKVTTLPMADGGSPYRYKSVYSIALPTIPAGSIIDIYGDGEVTNNNSYNIGVASYFVIGTSDTMASYADAGIIIVSPPNGADIINSGTSGHNHMVMAKSSTYYVSSTLTGKYLNYIWYAYSSDATGGAVAAVMSCAGYTPPNFLACYGGLKIKITYVH